MGLRSALTTPTGTVAGGVCCAAAGATSPQSRNTVQVAIRIAASRIFLLAGGCSRSYRIPPIGESYAAPTTANFFSPTNLYGCSDVLPVQPQVYRQNSSR